MLPVILFLNQKYSKFFIFWLLLSCQFMNKFIYAVYLFPNSTKRSLILRISKLQNITFPRLFSLKLQSFWMISLFITDNSFPLVVKTYVREEQNIMDLFLDNTIILFSSMRLLWSSFLNLQIFKETVGFVVVLLLLNLK